MGINRVNRTGMSSGNPVRGISQGIGGGSSGSFQQQMGGQLKEQYKERAAALFDEINDQAAVILRNADMATFERYRRLISGFLLEVTGNAYSLSSEFIIDPSGRHRVYETISTIDEKLEALAADILNRNSEQIDYISRVDEIRGLVMDLLL